MTEMDISSELKKAIKENNAVIGTERTVKALKTGKLVKVYLSSNCPARVKADIETYSRMTNAAVETLSVPNDELGVICKKPYSISVLGLKA